MPRLISSPSMATSTWRAGMRRRRSQESTDEHRSIDPSRGSWSPPPHRPRRLVSRLAPRARARCSAPRCAGAVGFRVGSERIAGTPRRGGARQLRQFGRHDRCGERRHRHVQAHRQQADAAAGRGAGVRSWRDRLAAQRRRQGEPVLPARLQPGPRHRFRDLRGRHARQPAVERARARLLRSELADPRARRPDPLPQGPVLRRGRRLFLGRFGTHRSLRRPAARPRVGHARRRPLRAGADRQLERRRRRPAALRPRARPQQRPVGQPGEVPQGQRRPALQLGRRPHPFVDHRHGLFGQLELDRPDPVARRPVGADRSLRRDRPHRRRPHRAL